jgi:hypothetical protein
MPRKRQNLAGMDSILGWHALNLRETEFHSVQAEGDEIRQKDNLAKTQKNPKKRLDILIKFSL